MINIFILKKMKVIIFIFLLSLTLKTFANVIPVYIEANYNCFDLLHNTNIQVLKKDTNKFGQTYILLDTLEYLDSQKNNNDLWLDKKIDTIRYDSDYQTDYITSLGFKIFGDRKGSVFIFHKKNKKLLTRNQKNKFQVKHHGHLISGFIDNEQNKIIIYLKCCEKIY